MITLEEVGVDTILKYTHIVETTGHTATVVERPLLDRNTIHVLMCNGPYSLDRVGYGLFNDDNMIGYVLLNEKTHELDLFHVHPEYRNQGHGSWALRQLYIEAVAVDSNNVKAIDLYSRLGYKVNEF